MSEDLTNRLVVAVIERNEAKVWPTNAEKGSKPDVIHPPAVRNIHVRDAQNHGGHDTDKADKDYYEQIATILAPAGEILLVGHGSGKSNAVLKLIQHLERHHSDIAKKIVGSLDVNVPAMTDGELLAAARSWFDEPIHKR